MKAIVLTCDRYFPFVQHMIRTYDRFWPDHPFCFRIAVQGRRTTAELSTTSKVEFRQTPEDIKSTVLALLEDIPDNEWIYWSIDDKYLVDIDIAYAKRITAWIPEIEDEAVSGVSFARARGLLSFRHVDYADTLVCDGGNVLLRRRNYRQIWLHQYLRTKVLKHLFRGFPDRPFQPKEMDSFHRAIQLPRDHRLYVTIDNHVVFGESTTRGEMTKNCAESFVQHGLAAPDGFNRSEESKLIGRLPAPIHSRLKQALFERPAIAWGRRGSWMKAGGAR